LVAGLYLAPSFKTAPLDAVPPQMIISVPVHTAVGLLRADGAPVVVVIVQESFVGLYRAPVLKYDCVPPPQMIISLPVQTAL
jgi:hypothetical protein